MTQLNQKWAKLGETWTESEFGWQKKPKSEMFGKQKPRTRSTNTVQVVNCGQNPSEAVLICISLGDFVVFKAITKKKTKIKLCVFLWDAFISLFTCQISGWKCCKMKKSLASKRSKIAKLLWGENCFFVFSQFKGKMERKSTQSRRLRLSWNFPTLCRWTCLNFD